MIYLSARLESVTIIERTVPKLNSRAGNKIVKKYWKSVSFLRLFRQSII